MGSTPNSWQFRMVEEAEVTLHCPECAKKGLVRLSKPRWVACNCPYKPAFDGLLREIVAACERFDSRVNQQS